MSLDCRVEKIDEQASSARTKSTCCHRKMQVEDIHTITAKKTHINVNAITIFYIINREPLIILTETLMFTYKLFSSLLLTCDLLICISKCLPDASTASYLMSTFNFNCVHMKACCLKFGHINAQTVKSE